MTFEQLAKAVSETTIGRSRLTDLGKGVYTIQLDPKSDTSAFLVSDKKKKTPVSIEALAALRIVKSAADAATAVYTNEVRENAQYGNLQDSITNEGLKINENTKLEVVHKLRVKDAVTGDIIYRNEHYKNYADYVKASRKAALITADAERRAAFTEASEALRTGGLKTPTPALEDKNLVMIPVFTVS